MSTVLIADDEPIILKVLARFLERPGRTLLLAGSGEEALRLARERGSLEVALLDKNLGDRSGLEVARELRERDPDVQVILLTAYASLQSAVEAVQVGAYDYLTKPVDDFDALDLKVSNATEKARLAREHRRTVRELAESERRYRDILASMPDGLVVYDEASGTIQQANAAAERLFGGGAPLAGRDVASLFEDGRPVAGAQPGGGPVGCLAPGGQVFPADVSHGELTWEGRAHATLLVRDATLRERLAAERRAAEEQLRHAQKMDALSRLAGGIGHDLANLIAVLTTHAQALSMERPADEDLQAIQAAAGRASALVKQMMALSRRAPSSPTLITLEPSVAELATLLRRSLGAGVALEVACAAGGWPVRVDPGQVSQVLLNLAVNARDAMPAGGTITVRTANAAVGPGRGGPPGDYVQLEVQDTGTGMTEEVRQRLFEPFFTTKPAGHGTGLGLAVIHGIVAQAGGFIEVESWPGRGSAFRVLLPRAEAEHAAASRLPLAVGPAGG